MNSAVIHGDNLLVLKHLPSHFFTLIYVDPPFNTGKQQKRTTIKVKQASISGTRKGFANKQYISEVVDEKSYSDVFESSEKYWDFMIPSLEEAYRVLAENGSFYCHLDYREIHYCKIILDDIFGKDCFMNEIIWAYDFGGRPRNKWPPKHDNILFYAKNPGKHIFNVDKIDEIKFVYPGLNCEEPTDVWWHTIVPTNSSEKTGYPTQKPLGILRRIIEASSNPGDWILDFFAGSGTTGAAALELSRRFILIDNNPQAIETMKKRFAGRTDISWMEVKDESDARTLCNSEVFAAGHQAFN